MTPGVMSGGRRRRALWAGRRPLALVVLVLAGMAVMAVPSAAFEQPTPELRRVVSFGDSDWTVVWRASTAEESGQFRLYSGPALESLQLVDIQQATRGLAGYRFRDGRSAIPGWYYQLRYVSSKGVELILGSLRVDPVGLQTTPVSIHVPAPVAQSLPAAIGFDFALISLEQALPADVVVANAARPEPDVPPPRRPQPAA